MQSLLHQNYKALSATLSKYSGTYISVVASSSQSGLSKRLLGNYSFVTGTKMYWDATVPLIATSRTGHWFNIADSGASYDGAIGNSGNDYEYSIADSAFENSENNKNITFTRITGVKAVFLIAQIDNNNTFILADSNMAAVMYPFHSDVGSRRLVHNPANVVTTDWTTDAEYWIGQNRVVRTDFNRADNEVKLYGFMTKGNSGSLQANQTLGNGGGARAWIGKYQKLIVLMVLVYREI